jgi:hypothetical protein
MFHVLSLSINIDKAFATQRNIFIPVHKYGQALCFHVLSLSINMDRPYVLYSFIIHKYGQAICFYVLVLS